MNDPIADAWQRPFVPELIRKVELLGFVQAG